MISNTNKANLLTNTILFVNPCLKSKYLWLSFFFLLYDTKTLCFCFLCNESEGCEWEIFWLTVASVFSRRKTVMEVWKKKYEVNFTLGWTKYNTEIWKQVLKKTERIWFLKKLKEFDSLQCDSLWKETFTECYCAHRGAAMETFINIVLLKWTSLAQRSK